MFGIPFTMFMVFFGYKKCRNFAPDKNISEQILIIEI